MQKKSLKEWYISRKLCLLFNQSYFNIFKQSLLKCEIQPNNSLQFISMQYTLFYFGQSLTAVDEVLGASM